MGLNVLSDSFGRRRTRSSFRKLDLRSVSPEVFVGEGAVWFNRRSPDRFRCLVTRAREADESAEPDVELGQALERRHEIRRGELPDILLQAFDEDAADDVPFEG